MNNIFFEIEFDRNCTTDNWLESSCEYVSQKCTQQVNVSWQYDDGTHFLPNNKSEGYENL